MDFPITELLDQDAYYAKLVECLNPDGFASPRCHEGDRMAFHRRHRPPVQDFRCGHCRRVFNAFTDATLHGINRRPSEPVLIVQGFTQRMPNARLAREVECDRSELLIRLQCLQDLAFRNRGRMPVHDKVLEADEVYQNAGKNGVPHTDPDYPPRRRGNQARGHGSRDNDRPTV
jgi:hypothetical protein